MRVNTKSVLVALSMTGLFGCGSGGGSADPRRTELACAYGSEACVTAHSDVPIEINCTEDYTEVESCSESDVLATCTQHEFGAVAVTRFYDADTLDHWEVRCREEFGTWEDLSTP